MLRLGKFGHTKGIGYGFRVEGFGRGRTVPGMRGREKERLSLKVQSLGFRGIGFMNSIFLFVWGSMIRL